MRWLWVRFGNKWQTLHINVKRPCIKSMLVARIPRHFQRYHRLPYQTKKILLMTNWLEWCLAKNNENRSQQGMFEHNLIDNITSVVYNTMLYVSQPIWKQNDHKSSNPIWYLKSSSISSQWSNPYLQRHLSWIRTLLQLTTVSFLTKAYKHVFNKVTQPQYSLTWTPGVHPQPVLKHCRHNVE